MALLIDNEVSAQLLTMRDCLEALEAVFREEGRGEGTGRNKSAIHMPTKDPDRWYRYTSMEGGSRELGVVAVRIKSDVVTWPTMYGMVREQKYTGRPGKFGGLILLFGSETGELLAILNDGWLQHMRVGATYGIGARYQARKGAEVMGLLGSGGMARTYVEAVTQYLPIKRIQVYSPSQEHREAYADEMSEKLGIHIQPVESAEAAVAGADVIASMTDAMNPTITAEMLRPGVHVTAVSNWELHAEAYQKVDRMVTQRDGISDHHYTTPEERRPRRVGGSFHETARMESAIPAERVHRLPDVLLGRAVGRASDDEITYFIGEGTGLQFAAVGARVYELARARGLGQELPSEWFLQDIRT